jgi:hypothetical protein
MASLVSAVVVGLSLLTNVSATAVTSAGPLFSLAFTGGSTPVLDAVDPASGAAVEVANLSGIAPNEQFLGIAPDPDARALHAVMEWCNPCGFAGVPVDQVVTIVGSTIYVSPVLATRLGGFTFDPLTRLLWAVTNCYTCTSQSLVTVNPATGVETPVATIPIATFGPTDSVAIVPTARKLYLYAGSLYPFDMQKDTFGPPTTLSTPLSAMVYDAGSKNLVGLGTPTGSQEVVRVDPNTGTETELAHFLVNQSAISLAVDPIGQTVLTVVTLSAGGQFVESVNDVTAATSTGSAPADTLGPLAFMGPQTRFVAPGPTASPGGRTVNQLSGSSSPGPRLPVPAPALPASSLATAGATRAIAPPRQTHVPCCRYR